jgi:hypothetical protein
MFIENYVKLEILEDFEIQYESEIWPNRKIFVKAGEKLDYVSPSLGHAVWVPATGSGLPFYVSVSDLKEGKFKEWV